MVETYSVNWSKTVKVITTVVVIGYLALSVYVLWGLTPVLKDVVGLGFGTITLGYIAGLAPKSITLDNTGLTVKRVIGCKRFGYADISDIGLSYTPMALRVCGSGGFCGYIGWFKSPGFGMYFSYMADKSEAFYIILKNGRKYMLSCGNPDDVIEKVRRHAGI